MLDETKENVEYIQQDSYYLLLQTQENFQIKEQSKLLHFFSH